MTPADFDEMDRDNLRTLKRRVGWTLLIFGVILLLKAIYNV